MKVSVIVPVYNVEKYIYRCFESISKQTYDNIECIFVDDCSPDNSYSILKKLIEEYRGNISFSIHRHHENKGLSGARNTGTRISGGDYIYYLDSDDEITPLCIEVLVNKAKKYNGVEIVQGNTRTIPSPKRDKRDIALKNFPEFVDDRMWIKKHCFSNPRIPVNAWNKLIKKSFLADKGLFFREGIVHEDEYWMFFVAKELATIAFASEYCYVHYIVPGSIMQRGNSRKSWRSSIELIKVFSTNIDKDIRATQIKYILSLLIWRIKVLFRFNCLF
jgi:glycosyltransferase involved in cell wall biosynthesis